MIFCAQDYSISAILVKWNSGIFVISHCHCTNKNNLKLELLVFWNQDKKIQLFNVYGKKKKNQCMHLEWCMPTDDGRLRCCRLSLIRTSAQRYFEWVEYKRQSIAIDSGSLSIYDKTQERTNCRSFWKLENIASCQQKPYSPFKNTKLNL